MKYRWSIAPSQPALTSFLARELKLSPLLAQCLLNRGFSEPEPIARFLEPRLKSLADPFLIPNMRAAVERLVASRERSEALVVFGDYDVDGVTSTALLFQVLTVLGWRVASYLPHRIEEGYGLTRSAAENCLARHATRWILALDCGYTSTENIVVLGAAGVNVVVVDHHPIGTPRPPAAALVNPHDRIDSDPDFRELCTVGLAFKLAHALVKEGRRQGWKEAHQLDLRAQLELVALGTIADLVPLRGENRILVSAGVQRLRATTRPGARHKSGLTGKVTR